LQHFPIRRSVTKPTTHAITIRWNGFRRNALRSCELDVGVISVLLPLYVDGKVGNVGPDGNDTGAEIGDDSSIVGADTGAEIGAFSFRIGTETGAATGDDPSATAGSNATGASAGISVALPSSKSLSLADKTSISRS